MPIEGTAGNDDLTGTGVADDFLLFHGGDDIARGLGDNDSFAFGAAFTRDDQVFGGGGFDTILLSGDAGAIHVAGSTIESIEQIFLVDGADYELHMKDGKLVEAEKDPKMAEFMGTKVSPQMAEIFGKKPFDPATGEGFGCGGCHKINK